MIPSKNSRNLLSLEALGLSKFLLMFIQDDLVDSFYLTICLEVFNRGHLVLHVELF